MRDAQLSVVMKIFMKVSHVFEQKMSYTPELAHSDKVCINELKIHFFSDLKKTTTHSSKNNIFRQFCMQVVKHATASGNKYNKNHVIKARKTYNITTKY